MNVTPEWWSANSICTGWNYEDLEEIKGTVLTHVASVQVVPPWGRHDLQCHIYGKISFNVAGDTRDFVTLYSRDKDNAEFMDLADDTGNGSYLTLSDRHVSQRPLQRVKSPQPLLFNMELYETIGGLEGKDTLIAKEEGLDSYCFMNQSNYFIVKGKLGFTFELGYSVVFGARVEVGVKVKKIEVDPDRGISMWGHIGAYQFLEKLDHSPCGETFTLMRVIDKTRTRPVTLNVGDQIELERKFVVAPMGYDAYLCVHIAPRLDEDDCDVHQVSFPLTHEASPTRSFVGSFWINKERTHTKDISHNGTVFSVSITFIPPEENEHVPKIPSTRRKLKESQGVEV